MQVKSGERTLLDAAARVEPTEDLLFHDYYTRTPRVRLIDDAVGQETPAEPTTEILLDGPDVAKLIECAVRHPSLNMRQCVLTAIWNHPESFRAILRFGLGASEAFAEIRKIVAEELQRHAAAKDATSGSVKPAGEALLPRMPLPAHLRHRQK